MLPAQNKNNNNQAIEDIPVHTMQEDLDGINNPKSAETSKSNTEPTVQRAPINPNNLSAAQKSSPFLNPTPEIKRPEPSRPEPIKVLPQQPNQPAPAAKDPLQPTPKTSEKSDKKPFILIGVAVVAIILCAVGGYLFWTTYRQLKVTGNEVPAQTVPEPTPVVIEEPVASAKPSFSVDKPNYLNIDLATADAAAVKEIIRKYAQDVTASGITTPIEFIVTDLNNNPIKFADFSTKLNIALSKLLAANLKDTFSLFIYTDGSLTRLGLAIDSKDVTKLKPLMTAEEKTLAKELQPIFLSTDYTMEIKSFGSSTYNDLPIRFANITSPEDLSVDYTIASSKLLIGTTKMTLRSIIDYIGATNKPTATTPTPATPASPATPPNTIQP